MIIIMGVIISYEVREPWWHGIIYIVAPLVAITVFIGIFYLFFTYLP